MKKIIIFIILINLMAGGYPNNNPKQLTKNDLNITRNFEVLANKIINKKPKKLNISKIYQTIIQYSKLKYKVNNLKLYATATARKQVYNSADTQEPTSAFIAITAKYNLLDDKEQRDIKKQNIILKQQIINDINNYINNLEDIENDYQELELLELKNIRAKTRQKAGIINLDDRIKIIDNILKIKQEIREKEQKKEILKLKLLSYVKDEFRNKIERLLR
jgi:hypothetical protein